jgi:hypothetical protein
MAKLAVLETKVRVTKRAQGRRLKRHIGGSAIMSTGIGPYVGTDASDTDDTGVGSPVIETTLIVSQASVNIGSAIARSTI